MKLVYISQGNIPSRWAHTIQAMKMAEALKGVVEDTELVTSAHWSAFLRPRYDFETHYGIRRRFRIVRLPTRRRWRDAQVHRDEFDEAAARYAARKAADLVYTRSAHAARASVELGIGTILELHGATTRAYFSDVEQIREHPRLLGIVTITEQVREQYVAFGIPEEKLLVWPDAVSLEAYDDRTGAREALRRQLGIADDRLVVTYCGHLYANRGVDSLVRAAPKVADVQFLLVGGWDSDIERVRGLAREVGAENVRLEGFVPYARVPDYLLGSDVLVASYLLDAFPAKWGSPLKLFEYMAARRPIIASDVPALVEHLVHEENALVVPPGDEAALVSAVRRLTDERLRRELADRAFETVAQYTWDNRAQAILDRFTPGVKR